MYPLSDAELIAILIGSGNRDESAVELARRMLLSFDSSLNSLGKKTVMELMQFVESEGQRPFLYRLHWSSDDGGRRKTVLKNHVLTAAAMHLQLCSLFWVISCMKSSGYFCLIAPTG
jgi:hypothetical protein